MEINVQQMESLLHLQEQQAQLPRKTNVQTKDFKNLLNQKIGDETAQTALADPALTGASLYSRIMLENNKSAQPENADMAVLQAAFDQASGALDLWDSYARALDGTSDNASLKNAYTILEGIDGQIAQLKQNPAFGHNQAFDGLLNELEILSATEKFKFNRGDYLN